MTTTSEGGKAIGGKGGDEDDDDGTILTVIIICSIVVALILSVCIFYGIRRYQEKREETEQNVTELSDQTTKGPSSTNGQGIEVEVIGTGNKNTNAKTAEIPSINFERRSSGSEQALFDESSASEEGLGEEDGDERTSVGAIPDVDASPPTLGQEIDKE